MSLSPIPRRILAALILVVAAGLLRPAPASACIYNWGTDGFSPLPPCSQEDEPARQTLKDKNQTLLGKIGTTVGRIYTIKKRIESIVERTEQVVRYAKGLTDLHGGTGVNPLRSMAAEFNRMNPMGRYVRLGPNGVTWNAANPTDLTSMGDSLFQSIQNEVGLQRMFETSIRRVTSFPERTASRVEYKINNSLFGPGSMWNDELVRYGDYQQALMTMADTLMTKGRQTGARYAGASTTKGESEAKISQLSAVLSRARGAQMKIDLQATITRMRMADAAIENRQEFADRRFTLETAASW